MANLAGLHHLAISTNDMKGQIEFFSDVLGMRLTALYWMHGVEGAWHGFLQLGDSSVAFVFLDGNKDQETVVGQTHAGHGGGTSAPGTMQHVAFSVDTQADLLAMRDRIRSRGVNIIGPIHHGMCSSIYFAGPENLTLEVATSGEAGDPLDTIGTWIDPEVMGLAGISRAEAERYMNPEGYDDEKGGVAQPPYDASKPHMAMPKEAYQMSLQAPDEAITAAASETTAPSPGGLK